MQNAGSKYAGSITAALFIQQFVDTSKVQWAHIDIAGYVPSSHYSAIDLIDLSCMGWLTADRLQNPLNA